MNKYIFLLPLLSVGCVDLTVEEPRVCSVNSFNVDVSPSTSYVAPTGLGLLDASTFDASVISSYDASVLADSGASLSGNMVSVSGTNSFDLSDAVKQLQKTGTVKIAITSDMLSLPTGDFSWLSHVKLTIVPNDGTSPPLVLVDQDVSDATNTLTVQVLPTVDDNNLLNNYFGEGRVSLNYEFTGQLNSSLTSVLTVGSVDNMVCLSASTEVKKSL